MSEKELLERVEKPNVYIFAGINGAGKTTLYYNELECGKLFGYRINIDEIVSSFGDWKNPNDQTRGAKIAIKQRQTYIKSGYTFNQETTLRGQGILALLKKIKAKGYVTNLYYVGLDSVELAKERVEQRMLKGGHFVSSKVIERRYPKSLQNLKEILPIIDNAYIYDNSNGFKIVAIKENNKLHVKNKVGWFSNIFK